MTSQGRAGREVTAAPAAPTVHNLEDPVTSAPETARAKLDRLKQMADEAERDNPETPIADLLDLQRALQRTLPKMRALHAAGWRVNATALTDRIGGLLREIEELLGKETGQ